MRALAALILLAACGGDDVDPGVDARGVEPGPIDGAWSIAWSCESSCATPRPDMTRTTTLTVTSGDLTFGGGPGGGIHRGAVSGTCVDVPAGSDGGRNRVAYRVCRQDATATASIAWGGEGNPAAVTTWRLQAWR